MKVLVPLVGDSSRFPKLRPKWLLTHPKGKLMIELAVKDLYDKPSNLYFIIRQDHNVKYSVVNVLKKCFGTNINILILPYKTNSQNETIKKGIEHFKLEEEKILIRDCDSQITIKKFDKNKNQVFLKKLTKDDKADNKGYAVIKKGLITQMYEKIVNSNTFCVGGYYFTKGKTFLNNYEGSNVSQVINQAINNGEKFHPLMVESYEDYGTSEEWDKLKEAYKVYFIDIDGVLTINCSYYFKPYWGEEEIIKPNFELIKSLPNTTQIIFVTSRPHSFKKETLKFLDKLGLEDYKLIMGVNHSTRIIINDFTHEPTCKAINVKRDGKLEL